MPYRLGTEIAQSVRETISFPDQIQGVGMELTVKSILAFCDRGTIGFDNKDRILPRTQELYWDKYDHDRLLFPGVYLANLNELVSIPKDKIGFAIPRSSLLRMGVTLGTAVWDPGYVGHGQVLLEVHNSFGLTIKKNARILQLVFADLESEAVQLYDGIYQEKA
jgi:dUTP pyrophosphatase